MSGDVMQFPKTVEEFMEKYKVVDTEQVYTNGTELVPIFRMEQWFEHIGAEPVRHGKWIYVKGSNGKDYRKCSECLHTQEITGLLNYCPVCGARMEGVDE